MGLIPAGIITDADRKLAREDGHDGTTTLLSRTMSLLHSASGQTMLDTSNRIEALHAGWNYHAKLNKTLQGTREPNHHDVLMLELALADFGAEVGETYEAAGLASTRDASIPTERAIRDDPSLKPEDRRTLLAIYRRLKEDG